MDVKIKTSNPDYGSEAVNLDTLNRVVAQIPPPPSPTIYRINEMFNFPSDAEFIAELHKSENTSESDFVILRAYDNTDITAPLTIEPEFGFGAKEDSNVVMSQAIKNDDGTFNITNQVIEIVAENPVNKCQIKIPAECDKINLFYFVGQKVGASYWVDVNNVYHSFELENTPLSSLSTNLDIPTVTINGETVVKNTVKKIVFGDSYLTLTGTIPQYFISRFRGLTDGVDFYGLQNVTGIGSNFIDSSSMVNKFDFSVFTKVITINDYFISSYTDTSNPDYISYLTFLDLSNFISLTSVGNRFLNNVRNLKEIQIGNIDWSTITIGVSSFINIPNVSTSTLYADSQILADNFKAKFPQISNWSVVINS